MQDLKGLWDYLQQSRPSVAAILGTRTGKPFVVEARPTTA